MEEQQGKVRVHTARSVLINWWILTVIVLGLQTQFIYAVSVRPNPTPYGLTSLVTYLSTLVYLALSLLFVFGGQPDFLGRLWRYAYTTVLAVAVFAATVVLFLEDGQVGEKLFGWLFLSLWYASGPMLIQHTISLHRPLFKEQDRPKNLE